MNDACISVISQKVIQIHSVWLADLLLLCIGPTDNLLYEIVLAILCFKIYLSLT